MTHTPEDKTANRTADDALGDADPAGHAADTPPTRDAEEERETPAFKKPANDAETSEDTPASKKHTSDAEAERKAPASKKLAKDAEAAKKKTPASTKSAAKSKKTPASSKPAPKKPTVKKPAAKQPRKRKAAAKEASTTPKRPPKRKEVLLPGHCTERSSSSESDTGTLNHGLITGDEPSSDDGSKAPGATTPGATPVASAGSAVITSTL